jgi:hypothetical protein
MFIWERKPNKILKPWLIPFRIVGILTHFIFICFLMVPKSHYLNTVNHKIVMWDADSRIHIVFYNIPI